MKRLLITLFVASCILVMACGGEKGEVASPVEPPEVQEQPSLQEARGLLDVWLQSKLDYDKIPGMVVAVVHDQKVVYLEEFGYANLEKEIEAQSRTTLWRVSSISKLFTAIAVVKLSREGRLGLDNPLGDHLERVSSRSDIIPIRSILTHTSGLPRDAYLVNWTGPDFNLPTAEGVIQGLAGQKKQFEPGTDCLYSSLGYALLGMLVGKVSGVGYEEYVRRNILAPLNMDNTHVELPQGDELAVGYSSLSREGVRTRQNPVQYNGLVPAAGLASTVIDMARFARWQFRVLGGAEEILDRDTLLSMYELGENSEWGLGFDVWESDSGETFVGHSGYGPGYSARFILQPEKKISVIVMANCNSAGLNDMTDKIYEIIAPGIDLIRAVSHDLTCHTGLYDDQPWNSEVAIVGWNQELGLIYLPSDDPLRDMKRLKWGAGLKARVLRKGELTPEEVRFNTYGFSANGFWKAGRWATFKKRPVGLTGWRLKEEEYSFDKF